ncbi:hypothetical protein M422DRAFT_49561 [Sphaerobolus stellatus SS14]|uniref:DDE-1 domain-containing protein n=1 Tax=Sphaerobolus stellatus (strain SS14) TaxID=990650 RepID=A0A0C9U903_SPHS4|nr:hypothetical protein M422DRAFT_49561 [Sphaerobolus stellatus SS14]
MAFRSHTGIWRRLQIFSYRPNMGWPLPRMTLRAAPDPLEQAPGYSRTHGMDKSGFPPEASQTTQVIGGQGVKTQHKQGNTNHENVTAIVNFIDGELALQWFIKDFDEQTCAKAAGKSRALFMDGHNSHYTPELLRHALESNIQILGYPPKCTHALQGLDVVCFACMKAAWNIEVTQFEEENSCGVNKTDFAGVFRRAFQTAFIPETVKAAFEATGLVPYNPNIITQGQMKPSQVTSTRGYFPMPQPSPIHPIIDAFVMSFGPRDPNLDPNLFLTSSKCALDADPMTPETPSKRMWIIASRIAGTKTGSMLLSNEHYHSSNSLVKPVPECPPLLPQPNWNLLNAINHAGGDAETECLQSLGYACAQIEVWDKMLERAYAIMILQDFYLHKLNQALHKKEEKK